MTGDELAKRIGCLRTDARGLAKLTLLWRYRPQTTAGTAADYARQARGPLQRRAGKMIASRSRPAAPTRISYSGYRAEGYDP